MKKPPLALKILVPVVSLGLIVWFVAYRVSLVEDDKPLPAQEPILSSSKSAEIFKERRPDTVQSVPTPPKPIQFRTRDDRTNGSAADPSAEEVADPFEFDERMMRSSKSGDIFSPPKEADTPVQKPRTIMGSSKSKAVFEPEPEESAPNPSIMGSSKSAAVFKPPRKDSVLPKANQAPNQNNMYIRPK